MVGLETELMLVDDRGYVSNRAAELVAHPKNTGNIVPEFCNAVVEANPPPSTSIAALEANLFAELTTIQSISDSMGIRGIPLSEVGPGDHTHRNMDKPRYLLFEEAVGGEHSNLERSLCGTHLHVDHKDDIVSQYNVLLSMDPVFVLMSSSSLLRGFNSLNCGRVDLFRNALFRGSPHLSQLLDYISTEEDLNVLERSRSDYFLDRLARTAENRRLFGGFNNGSTPLRRTKHTIEIRCADSNMPSLAIAMAALYKGVLETVFEGRSLDVRISSQDSTWSATNSEIMLPSHRTLKLLESEGITTGVRSPSVHRYLSYLLTLAERGLPSEEARYLRPFKEILKSERNVADLLRYKARLSDPAIRETFAMPSAAAVNLFIARQYRDEVGGGSQLLDMITSGIG